MDVLTAAKEMYQRLCEVLADMYGTDDEDMAPALRAKVEVWGDTILAADPNWKGK